MLPRFRSGRESDGGERAVPLAGRAAHDQQQMGRLPRGRMPGFRGADSRGRRTRGLRAPAPVRVMLRNAPAVADGRRRRRENGPHPVLAGLLQQARAVFV